MAKITSRCKELRKKTAEDLRNELSSLRREIFNLRIQKAVQQTEKTSEFRRVHRDIARTLTIAKEGGNA